MTDLFQTSNSTLDAGFGISENRRTSVLTQEFQNDTSLQRVESSPNLFKGAAAPPSYHRVFWPYPILLFGGQSPTACFKWIRNPPILLHVQCKATLQGSCLFYCLSELIRVFHIALASIVTVSTSSASIICAVTSPTIPLSSILSSPIVIVIWPIKAT